MSKDILTGPRAFRFNKEEFEMEEFMKEYELWNNCMNMDCTASGEVDCINCEYMDAKSSFELLQMMAPLLRNIPEAKDILTNIDKANKCSEQNCDKKLSCIGCRFHTGMYFSEMLEKGVDILVKHNN